MVDYIPSMENLVDLFTKTLTKSVFVGHKDNMGSDEYLSCFVGMML